MFQVEQELVNKYFHCHMKETTNFTHNVSSDKIDLLFEMNVFKKLQKDFWLN